MSKRGLDAISAISNVTELNDTFFLHPNIEINDDIYLASVYGRQTLIMVKEKELDNSDGSEWRYPGQTKKVVYYLQENEGNQTFNWDYLSEIKDKS